MDSSFFENAKDFSVSSLNVDNVDGNYTDARHTSVEANKIKRQVYDQTGAVGVVNGRGRFTGNINHGGGAPAPKRRKDRYEPSRSQTVPNVSCPTETGDIPSQNRGESGSGTPRSDRPGSESTYFKNAEGFQIGNMDVRNTSGDFIDQRTTHIQRNRVREKHCDQQGAVGVVNDRGKFSGTINYGQGKKKSKPAQPESSSEEEESESEEESSEDEDPRGIVPEFLDKFPFQLYSLPGYGRRYDQRGAVGVVNDRGRFSGDINYNTYPQKQRAKEGRGRDAPYTLDDSRGSYQPFIHEPSPYRNYGYDEPLVDVQSSPPPSQQYGSTRQQQPEWQQCHQEPLLGLRTPPPTPGAPHYQGAAAYVDKNPFRRMTAPASAHDISGLASQVNKMSMQNPQAPYASPPPTGHGTLDEGARYFNQSRHTSMTPYD